MTRLLSALVWLLSSASYGATLHEQSLVIDGHNDLPWALRELGDLALKTDLKALQVGKLNTDIPRLKQGNLGAQFWSVFVPVETMKTGTAYKTTLEQIDVVNRLVAKYSEDLELAASTKDIRHARANGKIASLIGVEGGHSIEESVDKLRDLYRRGARYMTLSHSKNLSWVESATDKPMAVALNEFGKSVVKEMNHLGMFVDISHISASAMREVLKVAAAPVIASHSSAYAVKAHPRNVPDDVLKLVAANGGVVMVNFYSVYVTDKPTADVSDVVDHIDHIVQVAGIDHVGLGSDFDGVPELPTGLEDVSKYPNITAELQRRGYSDGDIKKVLGENLMRAFAAVEAYAAGHP